MSNIIKQRLEECADHYGARVREMGTSAKAAGWRDEATQTLRFEQLYKIIDPTSPFSLADLGCGYGAFYNAMSTPLKNVITRYDGYDISKDMVEAANKKYEGDTKTNFIVGDSVASNADYVVESGIFNHHFNTPHEEWTNHIHATIKQMYAACEKGMAFNIMSDRVDFQEDYIYYADPAAFLNFSLDTFGSKVQLLHDYPLYEFTILVRK